MKLRVESPARLVTEARRHDVARGLHSAPAVDPRLGVALQLQKRLLRRAVVSLEEPAVPAHERLKADALVGGDGHIPAGSPLVEALPVRHQDLLARGVLPFKQAREVVRLHTSGKAELLGRAPVPAGRHDALALALGVVVPKREFAPVVVARLGGAQRWRRAQHDATSVAHWPVRPGPRSPVEGGSVPRGSEDSKSERPPSVRSGTFHRTAHLYYGLPGIGWLLRLSEDLGARPPSPRALRGSPGGIRPLLKNENHARPATRTPRKSTGARGVGHRHRPSRPRAGRVPGGVTPAPSWPRPAARPWPTREHSRKDRRGRQPCHGPRGAQLSESRLLAGSLDTDREDTQIDVLVAASGSDALPTWSWCQ